MRGLGQNPVQQISVRPPDQRGLLRLAHLGRRHHLHRLGDLGGVPDRPDASAYVAQVGHEIIFSKFAGNDTAATFRA
jgi:hypothetical protein